MLLFSYSLSHLPSQYMCLLPITPSCVGGRYDILNRFERKVLVRKFYVTFQNNVSQPQWLYFVLYDSVHFLFWYFPNCKCKCVKIMSGCILYHAFPAVDFISYLDYWIKDQCGCVWSFLLSFIYLSLCFSSQTSQTLWRYIFPNAQPAVIHFGMTFFFFFLLTFYLTLLTCDLWF